MKKFIRDLRYNLPASIVVFFVALPLCLGIALASGAPLFAGIIAGIVGGVFVGSASGSSLGVSGPAAGLAVIVFGYIATLGSWENFLTAVLIAGLLQMAMGYLKLGNIAYYFPSSVIKGMLWGIGIIIVIKQIPRAFGYNTGIESDLEEMIVQGSFTAFEQTLSHITPKIVLISAISLLIMITWENFLMKKHKVFKILQGPLVVVFVGILLSQIFDLNDNQLVQIPVASGFGEFLGQFSLPNFDALKNLNTYFAAITIAAVASLETLLCVEATDKLDPMKRVTPTNRELKAQGLGNLISGLIGGLPITQVIVRSSANISFGAKTKASAIFHGIWLLVAALSFPHVLNMIPLASLSAILLVVGYKLANLQTLKKTYQLGFEQFAPFAITVIGMVCLDLLKGVALGMFVAICFILYHNFRNSFERIKDEEGKNNHHLVTLAQEVSFLNKGAILQMLEGIPQNSSVVIDGTKSKIIDYDVIEIIQNFQVSAKEKNIEVETRGISITKSK